MYRVGDWKRYGRMLTPTASCDGNFLLLQRYSVRRLASWILLSPGHAGLRTKGRVYKRVERIVKLYNSPVYSDQAVKRQKFSLDPGAFLRGSR